MPRLSIILPVLGSTHRLETTLVSVLENRPRDCEVIVVLNAPYDDPYHLGDEVEFVHAPPDSGWVAGLNAGIQASKSPIVHVLACGLEVAEGWTDHVLSHFSDPRVASVAPQVLDVLKRQKTLAAGLDYTSRRGRVLNDDCCQEDRQSPREILGPLAQAGFYRRAALELVGGFAAEAGDAVADADLALTLRYAGYRSILEPRAIVFATRGDIAPPAAGYKSALAAERLFWRAAPIIGWRQALLAHPASIFAEFVRALPWPSAFTALAGRLAGACRMRSHRAHHQWLLDVKRAAESLLSIRRRVPARSEKPFDTVQSTAASGRLAA